MTLYAYSISLRQDPPVRLLVFSYFREKYGKYENMENINIFNILYFPAFHDAMSRDDLLHPIASKAAASGHENVENRSFRKFRNHRPRTQALTPYPLPLLPETGRNEE